MSLPETRDEREGGFVLAVLLTALIPIVAMAAAASIALGGRSSRLSESIKQERALLAAESGIDEAVYASQLGVLTSGVPIERNLGGGMSVRIDPVYFGNDGVDNDGDGDIDATDPDEEVFQIIATGKYRSAKRRIAAYLGPAFDIPPAESATASQVAADAFRLNDVSRIDGTNTNLNMTLGDPAKSKHGLTIVSPNTVSEMIDELTSSEELRIDGLGGAPSIKVATESVDLNALETAIASEHDTKLVGSYWGFNFPGAVYYGDGRIDLRTSTRGSGVLCVKGDLYMKESARWDGTVIVTGSLDLADMAQIYGTILVGGASVTLNQNARIVYSQEAEQLAGSVTSVFGTLNGWQEI